MAFSTSSEFEINNQLHIRMTTICLISAKNNGHGSRPGDVVVVARLIISRIMRCALPRLRTVLRHDTLGWARNSHLRELSKLFEVK